MQELISKSDLVVALQNFGNGMTLRFGATVVAGIAAFVAMRLLG